MTGLHGDADDLLGARSSRGRPRRAPGRPISGLRVVVTGGTGFIGSHLVRELRDRAAQVTVVDLEPRGTVGVIACDVRDPWLGSVFAELVPEVVVHLAGQSRVVAALADPAADAHTNVVGAINVVSAAVRAGAGRIVLASSGGTVYGDSRQGHRAAESQPRRPVSPYGLSKATADAYLAMLAGDSGVSLALGNVYGPGDVGVCGQFLRALRRGERPRVVGDGTQTRDFVYIAEVCEAILRCSVAGPTGAFNIGTGRVTSVSALLTALSSALGVTTDPVFVARVEGEVRHNCLDIRRARRLLGWRPEVDLEEGIRRMVAAPQEAEGGLVDRRLSR